MGLIGQQSRATFAQLRHQFRDRHRRVWDLAEEARFATGFIRNRDRDGRFVNIKPHKFAKLVHDLPPQLRLCAERFTTLSVICARSDW